jgi:hypothetical protein
LSQAGLLDVASASGVVTSVVTDSGTAVPVGGVLNILGGPGITTSAAGNTVTITSTATGTAWSDEAAPFVAATGNGYFIISTLTATLPPTPTQGNTVYFSVDSPTAILTILANTGQMIRIGRIVSVAAGNAKSNFQGDAVALVYRAADTTWIALEVIGTWSIT